MAQQPWYTYPRIDNFGTIDPEGPYYKPDSNIQIPGYYPVTALLPGTITSLQSTGYGQDIATIKLDQPLNQEATHTFYEHLSSFVSGLFVGKHVSAGQTIGYNNPPGQVPLGFGLYSGDVYGSGPAWAQLQRDLAPGGPGLLNPTNLLNQASGGNMNTPGFGDPCLGCGPVGSSAYLTCHAALAAKVGPVPACAQQRITQNQQDIANANIPLLSGIEQVGVLGQVGHILQNLTNPDFWVRIGIGVGAVILVIMGLQLFIKDTAPAQQAAHDAKQTAKVATVAAVA